MDIFEENSPTDIIFILSFMYMYDSYIHVVCKLIAYVDEYMLDAW